MYTITQTKTTVPDAGEPDLRHLRLPGLLRHPPRVQRPRQGHGGVVLHGRGGRADDAAGRRQRRRQRRVHGPVLHFGAPQGPRRQRRPAAAAGVDPEEVRGQGLVSARRGTIWWHRGWWAATPRAVAVSAPGDEGQDSGQAASCSAVRSARLWCRTTCSGPGSGGSSSRIVGCIWWKW